jgi:hypothetical protein
MKTKPQFTAKENLHEVTIIRTPRPKNGFFFTISKDEFASVGKDARKAWGTFQTRRFKTVSRTLVNEMIADVERARIASKFPTKLEEMMLDAEVMAQAEREEAAQ